MEYAEYDDMYEESRDVGEQTDAFEGIRSEIVRHDEISEMREEHGDIAGEPMEAMEHWHKQGDDYSCAVACQEFVIEQLLGVDLHESDLAQTARLRAWYDPEGGTPVRDMGKLIEQFGLTAERRYNASLSDLEDALNEGTKVIAAVNNLSLAVADQAEAACLPCLTANHAVEVIGVDRTDPGQARVILNDPGSENGRGAVYDANEFMTAWNTGGNFAVFASRA